MGASKSLGATWAPSGAPLSTTLHKTQNQHSSLAQLTCLTHPNNQALPRCPETSATIVASNAQIVRGPRLPGAQIWFADWETFETL